MNSLVRKFAALSSALAVGGVTTTASIAMSRIFRGASSGDLSQVLFLK
jgi:hypothetical protein